MKFCCRSDVDSYEINGPDERLSSSDHSDKFPPHMFMYNDILEKNRTLQGNYFLIRPAPRKFDRYFGCSFSFLEIG